MEEFLKDRMRKDKKQEKNIEALKKSMQKLLK